MRAIAQLLFLSILSCISLGCASSLSKPRSLDTIYRLEAPTAGGTSSGTGSRRCPEPKPEQVIIYSQEGFAGKCRVLEQGNYANPSHFDPVPHNSVASMEVGSKVRVVLFEKRGFAGSKSFYDGGFAYASVGSVGTKVSSIAVTPAAGGRVASLYLGDHPNARENFWSDNTQGLANDGENWFIIRGFRAGDTRIYKVPLTYDLSSKTQGKNISVGVPASLKAAGYGHFGDPDRHEDFLFVPVQGAGVPPRIAVFATKDLRFITSAVIPNFDPSGGGWVAIRPGSDTLWVSGGSIEKDKGLSEYTIDWKALRTEDSLRLTFKQKVPVFGWDGIAPMTIRSMQGAVFNSDGTIMYIASGFCDSVGYVHAVYFDRNAYKGILQASSSNGGDAPFNYETEPEELICAFGECACTSDEAEGIDWIDVEGKGVPGVPAGKLHVVLIDNDLFSKDNLYLKHYGD